MRRGLGVAISKNSVALVTIVVCFCCLLVVLITLVKLPEVDESSSKNWRRGSYKTRKVSSDVMLGLFGEMMVNMLPQDLAFTIFAPSEEAFHRDLHLSRNQSFATEYTNDTYAIVSRVLGFSAIPRLIRSVDLRVGQQVAYDSLSGLTLHISKDRDGGLVVNRIRSEMVDLRKNEMVVHILNGVIMDAEFEQSVLPEEAE